MSDYPLDKVSHDCLLLMYVIAKYHERYRFTAVLSQELRRRGFFEDPNREQIEGDMLATYVNTLNNDLL